MLHVLQANVTKGLHSKTQVFMKMLGQIEAVLLPAYNYVSYSSGTYCKACSFPCPQC